MSEDENRFRTRVWQKKGKQEWLGSVTMDTADEEEWAAGYELLEHVTTHLEDDGDDERTIHIRIYERRPPTLREAGDAMAKALDGHVTWVGGLLAERLIRDWREAVENASTD